MGEVERPGIGGYGHYRCVQRRSIK
jgi:hypothetical protein